jgi:hypothetical protein
MECNPDFYYGCKTKPRTIIVKKKIPEIDYIYANLKASEWNISSVDCKKAQLLITKTWVDKYYFEKDKKDLQLNNERREETPITKELVEEIIEKEFIIEENDVIEKLPPLVILNETEKFKDLNGNTLEIETRGLKERNKIYFKVSDISKAFELPRLLNIITNDTRDGYFINIHYKSFNRNKIYINDVDYVANKNYKTTYLTYKGLLRVLFVSRSGIAEQFQDWAEDKLFTIQMGSKEEKVKLGTNILNISTKTYKAVFDSYASKFPSIYLLSLGKVGVLRNTFGIAEDINDDSVVYKYGFTDDLSRRIGEHEYNYGKLPNVTMKLSTFHIIDVKYTSEAEKEIREICGAFEKKLSVEGYNELIVLNEKEHGQIKKYYKHIGTECAGATLELQTQIIELKDKIKELEHDIINSVLSHKNELMEKDMLLLKTIHEKDAFHFTLESSYKNELLKKDTIILKTIHEKEALQFKLETDQIISNLKEANLNFQLTLLRKG